MLAISLRGPLNIEQTRTELRYRGPLFLAVQTSNLQPNDKFAIMPIFIYQRSKDGDPRHDWNQWVSFGARPEVFFTKYL